MDASARGRWYEYAYRLTMEPDFWVPPLIGPWVLKQRLMRGGTGAVNRIERLARETAALSDRSH